MPHCLPRLISVPAPQATTKPALLSLAHPIFCFPAAPRSILSSWPPTAPPTPTCGHRLVGVVGAHHAHCAQEGLPLVEATHHQAVPQRVEPAAGKKGGGGRKKVRQGRGQTCGREEEGGGGERKQGRGGFRPAAGKEGRGARQGRERKRQGEAGGGGGVEELVPHSPHDRLPRSGSDLWKGRD